MISFFADLKTFIFNFCYIPFAASTIYLGVAQEKILILTTLVLLDLFTGTLKSVRLDCDFKLKKFWIGIISKLALLLVPLSVALTAKGAGYDLKDLVGAVLAILILSEGYSVVRNAYIIKTGNYIESIDGLGIVLAKMKKILERAFDVKEER